MTENQKGQLPAQQKATTLKKRLAVYGTGAGVYALATMPTYAAAPGIDLSGLIQQFTELQTAIGGVISVAMTLLIAVVGWRWVKRAVGGI